MATAQVKALHEANGKPVVVVNARGVPQWSEVFENNPRISRVNGHRIQRLVNASGNRPYIASKSFNNWTWRKWDIAPGEVYFSDAERAFGAQHGGRVLIEPNTKVRDGNKAWIWERWQKLVDRGGSYVQVGPEGTQWLRGIERVETPTFRHALAVLAASKAYVGTEGGLHHGAAAVGVPAVVLFSEFVGTDITGYAGHRNLRHAGKACGARYKCASCKESMAAISVDEVERNLKEIL